MNRKLEELHKRGPEQVTSDEIKKYGKEVIVWLKIRKWNEWKWNVANSSPMDMFFGEAPCKHLKSGMKKIENYRKHTHV
jgi:hypothetical protein